MQERIHVHSQLSSSFSHGLNDFFHHFSVSKDDTRWRLWGVKITFSIQHSTRTTSHYRKHLFSDLTLNGFIFTAPTTAKRTRRATRILLTTTVCTESQLCPAVFLTCRGGRSTWQAEGGVGGSQSWPSSSRGPGWCPRTSAPRSAVACPGW